MYYIHAISIFVLCMHDIERVRGETISHAIQHTAAAGVGVVCSSLMIDSGLLRAGLLDIWFGWWDETPSPLTVWFWGSVCSPSLALILLAKSINALNWSSDDWPPLDFYDIYERKRKLTTDLEWLTAHALTHTSWYSESQSVSVSESMLDAVTL